MLRRLVGFSAVLALLLGAGEHGKSNFEAERLGGLEVEHRLLFGRRPQVGWLLALEDAIDVAGRPPVLVDVVSPVGDQAAGGDVGSYLE